MGTLRDNRARLALAAGAGAILIALAVALVASDSERRVAGTNLIAPLNPTVEVRPGGSACQPVKNLPGGAGYARVRADAGGGEIEPRISVTESGRPLSFGESAGPEGAIEVPLEPVTRPAALARVCVANRGGEPMLLYGERKRTRGGGFAYLYGVSFLEDEPSSLLTRADVAAQRFGNGQAGWLGAWAMWLALALAVAAAGVGMVVALRAGERG
jgi:hypothetical protein